jgi:hypothetical protein
MGNLLPRPPACSFDIMFFFTKGTSKCPEMGLEKDDLLMSSLSLCLCVWGGDWLSAANCTFFAK